MTWRWIHGVGSAHLRNSLVHCCPPRPPTPKAPAQHSEHVNVTPKVRDSGLISKESTQPRNMRGGQARRCNLLRVRAILTFSHRARHQIASRPRSRGSSFNRYGWRRRSWPARATGTCHLEWKVRPWYFLFYYFFALALSSGAPVAQACGLLLLIFPACYRPPDSIPRERARAAENRGLRAKTAEWTYWRSTIAKRQAHAITHLEEGGVE